MTSVPIPPESKPSFGFTLLVFAMVGLLILIALMLPSTPSRVGADPLGPPTSTPTVAPDCHLGHTWPIPDTPGPGTATAIPTPPEAMVRSLRGGMYYDYGGQAGGLSPTREWNGSQHILLVRVHGRMLTPSGCDGYYWNAPYALPTPSGTPSWELYCGGATATAQAAAIDMTAPLYTGALWLIGNEIDQPDMAYAPGVPPPPGYHPIRQDGIAPESYAEAYHDLYLRIKGMDPTALIAPGSVVQWTPIREEYYNRVLNAYQTLYGKPMEFEWFNVHAYNRQERAWYPGCGDQCPGYNQGLPPGFTPATVTPGAGTPTAMPTTTPLVPPYTYVNMLTDSARFEQQLVALRTWLKNHGYQDKPLIVSEFSIPRLQGQIEEPQAKTFFIDQAMPWMLRTTDPNTGYPYDGYHLVQRWIVFNQHKVPQNGFPFLVWNTQSQVWEVTTFGGYWIAYVNDPAKGYTGMGCAFGSTPQAWGPGAYGATWAEDSGAASQASSGGVLLDETPTPEVTSTPEDPYPGP